MKYRLVVFDLDGTIIDMDSAWYTLHEFFGIETHPRRTEAREYFLSKKITYQGWADEDIKMLKDHGASRNSVFDAIRSTKLMEGAIETLNELKKRGYKLAIISGGLDILLEKLIPDYKKIFDHVFINRMFFTENGEIDKVEATEFEWEHKKTGLLKICRLEKIDPKEAVFVGDHDNDVEIARAAGFSIAFNSKSEKLNKIADVVVEKKDLGEILKYL